MSFREYIMRIIVPHRRGIMGTVIFHLLLAILLLGMEIRKVEVHPKTLPYVCALIDLNPDIKPIFILNVSPSPFTQTGLLLLAGFGISA